MRTLVVFFFIVFCTVRVSGQESKQRIKWLTGTVLNSKQQPVKKAIIYLDSVKTKIKTDKKGQFKIGLKPDNKYISAYSWNYGIETIAYEGGDELVIVFPKSESIMSEDDLTELGFNTKIQKKKKEPKDYSKYFDMYQLIAMEVPGAVVTGTTIWLRGNAVNSIESGLEPLIIVDGVQAATLVGIWPREVASVRVLRDQNAAIYGTRGANGVIIIKMKNVNIWIVVSFIFLGNSFLTAQSYSANVESETNALLTSEGTPTSATNYPTLHKTVEVNGVDIFYREAGSKDAPTILLLHGYPTSSHMFRNLIGDAVDRLSSHAFVDNSVRELNGVGGHYVADVAWFRVQFHDQLLVNTRG